MKIFLIIISLVFGSFAHAGSDSSGEIEDNYVIEIKTENKSESEKENLEAAGACVENLSCTNGSPNQNLNQIKSVIKSADDVTTSTDNDINAPPTPLPSLPKEEPAIRETNNEIASGGSSSSQTATTHNDKKSEIQIGDKIGLSHTCTEMQIPVQYRAGVPSSNDQGIFEGCARVLNDYVKLAFKESVPLLDAVLNDEETEFKIDVFNIKNSRAEFLRNLRHLQEPDTDTDTNTNTNTANIPYTKEIELLLGSNEPADRERCFNNVGKQYYRCFQYSEQIGTAAGVAVLYKGVCMALGWIKFKEICNRLHSWIQSQGSKSWTAFKTDGTINNFMKKYLTPQKWEELQKAKRAEGAAKAFQKSSQALKDDKAELAKAKALLEMEKVRKNFNKSPRPAPPKSP